MTDNIINQNDVRQLSPMGRFKEVMFYENYGFQWISLHPPKLSFPINAFRLPTTSPNAIRQSFSGSQETLHILFSPKFHYPAHNSTTDPCPRLCESSPRVSILFL